MFMSVRRTLLGSLLAICSFWPAAGGAQKYPDKVVCWRGHMHLPRHRVVQEAKRRRHDACFVLRESIFAPARHKRIAGHVRGRTNPASARAVFP
jgi:hypothetical protein